MFMLFLQMDGVECPPTRSTDQHPAMQDLVKGFPVRDHVLHVLYPKKHGQQESPLTERKFLFQTTIARVHVDLGECTSIYQTACDSSDLLIGSSSKEQRPEPCSCS